MSKEKRTQRCYYDACTLDGSKQTLGEIINKKDPNNCIVSHLALGEAYGSSFKKKEGVPEAFIELMERLKKFINIVDHEGAETILLELLQDSGIRTEAADALHIATAIRYRCEVLRTLDRDLYGISDKKIKAFAGRYGLPGFSISQMER